MGEPLQIDARALPQSWVETAAHPQFAAAARRFALNMLCLCRDDGQLCEVFKDAGRYVGAMSAVYLHGAGGLTVSLLKQICVASGVLSAGRAQAIVEFLVHLDYLRPSRDGGGRYLPTDRFLAAWTRHLQAALDAAAVIDPTLEPLPARLDDPTVFEAFLAIQAARLHGLARGPNPFPALQRAFLHPYAGSQILWNLCVADSGEMPLPGRTIRISLSELARAYGVTHLHVRRLLRRAQDEGFFAYHGHGRLTFTPAGYDGVRYHLAFQLSELVGSGKDMLANPPPPKHDTKFVQLP